jgi:serine protease AprX
VVAPGTFILSTRSTQIALNNTAWAAYPPSPLYFHMGGTSMATPLTSGAVALIRQFYRTKKNIASATAALLKATLIAGATRLPGLASKSALFDIHQGYGRVNLDDVLAPAPPANMNFAEVSPGLRTGESHRVEIIVASNQVPLHVCMAYSDFPGPRLVNNLNIILTSPTGRRYIGNQTAGGALQLDQTNNVEVIRVNKPQAGKWTLQIIGSNVPRGPQDFAIVWIGNVS